MRNVILLTTVAVVSVFAQPLGQAPKAQRAAAVSGGSYIGVMMQEIDSERAKMLKLREEAGVEITRVEPDSPADKAGLKAGDVVLSYNGQRVEGMEQFKRLVSETPVGRESKLDIWRNGVGQTVTVKVSARRAPAIVWGDGSAMAAPMPMEHMDIRIPDVPRSFMTWRSSALGVEAEALEGQLAQYFGVKEGVLIRSVLKGSAAEKAGIKAGDVIMKIDDAKVTSPTDISSRLRSLRGKSVAVALMREHKELTLSVTVSDEDRPDWFWQGSTPRPMQFVMPNPVNPVQ